MRKFVVLSLVALFLLQATSWVAVAQEEDFSKGRGLGIGLQATFPPDKFPASGLSVRFWIADLLGFEVDLFWIPSFTTRSFLKLFNTEMVDLYIGGGVAIFSTGTPPTLRTPFQGVGGLEISLSHNLALNAEVGAYINGGMGVTAGLGAHFYF